MAGDPAQQEQGAFGVEAGGAGRETILDSLAGQAEDTSKFHLLAAFAQVQSRLFDQFIPQWSGRSRAERLTDPRARLSGRHQSGGSADGCRCGFEEGERQLRRELHLGRDSQGIHRECL